MSKNAALRLLAVGLLLCWCGLFLRTETTEKSMVRLIFADSTENGWTVGLLYQFPEAAADSADAAASVRLELGEGETPEKALLAAEKALHQQANYRLCEYLLLGPGWSGSALQTWEPLVQQHPELRLSIKLLAAEFSGAALAAQVRETEQLPEQLLQTVKTAASTAPRLYRFRRDQGILLPLLRLTDGKAELGEEGLLLSARGATALSAEETAMAALLLGAGSRTQLDAAGQTLTVRRSVCGVQAVGEGFLVDLTLQRRAGTPAPAEAQRQALQALCEETVRVCWKNGLDLLSLSAFRTQRDGPGQNTLTTKNACPELRADVRFLG